VSVDLGFVIARCGPVPVEVDRSEIHTDDAGSIQLYAFRCPGCDELRSGGDHSLLDARGCRGPATTAPCARRGHLTADRR